MAEPKGVVFREYTSDDSFTKLSDIPKNVSEIQVALTFARDYVGKNPTQGKFIPYWDTAIVTPEVIANFKKKYPSAKVLVSIGNNKKQFSFQIDEGKASEWIDAATESLTQIIEEYKLDGVDVYYEDIDVSYSSIFVNCIGEVIKTLKLKKVITRASISPNFATNDKFWLPLHQLYTNDIDNVAFQIFNGSVEENHTAITDSNKEILLENLAGSPEHQVVLDKLKTTLNQYPNTKLLLGYSGIQEDWPSALFLPPLFFVVCKLLLFSDKINGASMKVSSYSISYFPRNWILAILQSPMPYLNHSRI